MRATLTLVAGTASLLLFVPVVVSLFRRTDFKAVFPVLSFLVATLVLSTARQSLHSYEEGSGGQRVAVAGVLAAATSLGLCGLLFLVMLPLLFTGGA